MLWTLETIFQYSWSKKSLVVTIIYSQGDLEQLTIDRLVHVPASARNFSSKPRVLPEPLGNKCWRWAAYRISGCPTQQAGHQQPTCCTAPLLLPHGSTMPATYASLRCTALPMTFDSLQNEMRLLELLPASSNWPQGQASDLAPRLPPLAPSTRPQTSTQPVIPSLE